MSTTNQAATTPLTLDTGKTALIVVDMQNAFLGEEGSMNKVGLDITYLQKTAEPVRQLVDACHKANIPVIFTRYALRPDFKDAGCLVELFPALKDVNSIVSGTWDAELDERLGVKPGDFIVDKTRYSAFYNTNLEVILRGLGVDTVVVCGVTTEICVESIVRDAFFRDYRIVVPEDAVAAIDPLRHEGTLRTIRFGFGTVTTVDEITRAIAGVPVAHG